MSKAALLETAATGKAARAARIATAPTFVADLSFQDLQRLRKVVRKVHMRHYPSALLTDHEADKIIEAMGPQTSETLIKIAVDKFGLE